MLQYLFITLVFGACAYYDFKLKKVPDLLLALLWLAFGQASLPAMAYQMAVLAFGVVYFWNTIKQVWGWGDILGVGPVVGVFYSLGGAGFALGLVGLACCELWRVLKKEPMPLFPFIFVAYLAALLLKIVI